MKITIKVEKEINLTTVEVKAEVRYWEGADVNGIEDTEDGDNIPCKKGDMWNPIIDIETGTIINWEIGKTASICYKVCDLCSWVINSEEGEIYSVDDEYVPRFLCPKENGYGDYIIMDIDENGIIQKWNKNKLIESAEG